MDFGKGADVSESFVTGLKDTTDFLKSLPDKITEKIVKKSLRVGGNVLKNRIKQLAPVKTGATRKSIKIKTSRTKSGSGTVAIKVRVGVIKKFTSKSGQPRQVNYAKSLEFGIHGMPARPFVRPAFEETKDAILSEFVGATKAFCAAVDSSRGGRF